MGHVHRTHSARTLKFSTCLLGMLGMILLSQSGCINSIFMAAKVMMGDPGQTSGFEMVTTVNLSKGEHKVIVHCSAPSYINEDYGTLASDVEEELIRRMKRKGVDVLHPDAAADVLDRLGGGFDPKALAREMDVDYIMHIKIEKFSHMEESSPNLYRGHASGVIIGYEAVGEEGEDKLVTEVFNQSFKSNYPTTHPVPVDQTPKTVFIRKCVDHLADSLGASFYDVVNSSLFDM